MGNNTVEYGIRFNVEGDRTSVGAFNDIAASTVKLDTAAATTGQTLSVLNGQMNDTAAIMRRNAEASSVASQAAQQFLAPLQREIDLFGASRAEAERYRAAKAGLSAATQQQAAALGAAIDAMQRDEQAARLLAAEQDRATKAADAFLKKLQEQVATLGMNAQQLQAHRAAQLGVSDAAAPLIARLGETATGAGAAAHQVEGLNFKTVAARREMIVLAHELSQGNFQKFGGSMMVLGESTGAAGLLMSGAGLAAGALVATLVGLAYAAIKGATEQKHMNDALIETGNYAGETSDSLNAMAHAAVQTGGSIGEAKKAVTELAASGKFTGDQIGYITEAAVAMEHGTGKSIEATIKQFESLAVQSVGTTARATEAISRAALKLDNEYHFLTEAVYEQIRALEKEGDQKAASAVATEALAKVTKDRADEMIANLGTLARGWNHVKEAIGGVVDAIGDLGKKQTPGMDVAKYRAELIAFDKSVAGDHTRNGVDPNALTNSESKARLAIVSDLTAAVIKLNEADAAATAQGEKARVQSEANHAAQRVMADDVRLQKKGMTELQVAIQEYGQDLAKIAADNPNSTLLSQEAVNAHMAALEKAHSANVKGNDDRAKTLQDALVLEQAGLDREKSIYDARDKMLGLYHTKFGLSDDEFYVGRANARAEYIAAEAIAFARESSMMQAAQARARNPEEVAAAKTKYDELLKAHQKFVDDMRNAGGDDTAAAAAEIKKQYDDIIKATHDAGVATIKSLDSQIAKQREHNAEIGKTKEQIELARQTAVDLDTAQLESDADFIRNALAKEGFDEQAQAAYTIRLNDLDEEIKRRKELAGILSDGAALEANAKVAADASAAWKKASNTIENDLTNAILDGGGHGYKKLIRDMELAFAKTILQPILQPISSSIASALNPMATQAAGASAAGSGGGSMMGTAIGTVGSMFGAGGLAGSLAAGAGWLTGASTLGGSLAAGASLVGTGTLAGAMSGVGMLAGALGPIALGIGAVMMLAKAVDHSGTYHTGGAASASSSGTSVITAESLHFEATRTSADTEKWVSGLASGVVNILDSTALAFGKTAGYTAATAFADDSSKDGAWGGLVIDKLGQKIVDWQDQRGNGPWAPKVFADGQAGQDQYLAALSSSVRTALNDIGLPDWAKTMLDGLGSSATLEDMAKVVDQINATQRALTVMGDNLVGFAQLGDKATSALIAASGGIETLAGNASAYFDNFYSAGEKSASTVKQISDVLAGVGVAMPATREQFRATVEAEMALGEAGAPAVAALFKVAGAFAQVYPPMEETANAAQSAADALSERADLQQQLDQLTLSSTALLAKQRAALDASNRGLFDQVQAAQKAKDAQDAAKASLGDFLNKMKSFAESARAFHDGLQTGSLSTLTPEQQYAELRSQYKATEAAAMAGDTTAEGQYSAIAQAFLTASQQINGGDSQYAADMADVLESSDEAAKWAATQVDVSQAQLDAMTSQNAALDAANATLQTIAQGIENLPSALETVPAAPGVGQVDSAQYSTTDVTALTEEIKGLRASNEALTAKLEQFRSEQEEQTGDLMGSSEQISRTNAQQVVSGLGGSFERLTRAILTRESVIDR